MLFAALAGAGCAGTGQVGYGATATVSTPELVYVSPGVQVIANYDEPVFYSDNYYWRYDSGIWYRSPYHTRGWVRSYDVPTRIRSIDRPTAYIRYRGNNNRTVVRDHRQPAPRGNRVDADDRRRQQERQELIRDREVKRQEDRRDLIEDRNEQRQEDRQKLIDQRERTRQVDRQRLIEQRDREQKARERERARQNRR